MDTLCYHGTMVWETEIFIIRSKASVGKTFPNKCVILGFGREAKSPTGHTCFSFSCSIKWGSKCRTEARHTLAYIKKKKKKKSGVRSWYDWFLSRWNWIMKAGCLDRHPTAVEHLLFNHTIRITLGVRLKLQFFPYARTWIRYSSCRQRTSMSAVVNGYHTFKKRVVYVL